MKIPIVENLTSDERLKIRDFWEKLSLALSDLESNQDKAPLEQFLEEPVRFRFDKPYLLTTDSPFSSFIFYDKGKAYFSPQEGKERLLLEFDWNQLYCELDYMHSGSLSYRLAGNSSPPNLWPKGSYPRLKLASVVKGRDLIQILTHATWRFLRELPRAKNSRFVVFLPIGFYPFLVEPATSTGLKNIRSELSSRLGVRVILSPSLSGEGVLLFEDSFSPTRPVVPLCFLGFSESGEKKLYIYLDEPQEAQRLPFIVLKLRKSFFRKQFASWNRTLARSLLWVLTIPIVWEIYIYLRPGLVKYFQKLLEILKVWL